MIEKDPDELPEQTTADTPNPADLAQALKQVKTSSPELAAALDAAQLEPGELADAHRRATAEEPDPPQG